MAEPESPKASPGKAHTTSKTVTDTIVGMYPFPVWSHLGKESLAPTLLLVCR
jgi:hypothetical protein